METIKTNINSLSEFIEKCNLDKHYDCCEMVYINVEFIINNENIVNSFNLVVPFSNFNDIENDYEIYEFGWENFNLFINSVDFNSLIENEKKQRYIKKLQEQN